jgi:DNA-binding transcriptional LysR family regulator
MKARSRLQDRANWGKGSPAGRRQHDLPCQYLIPSILREFNECFPDCILNITPADTPELVQKLQRHELDLAIIVNPNQIH